MIYGIIGVIFLILIILIGYMIKKIVEIENKYYEAKRVCRYYRFNYSMLRYNYSAFKEGKNIYTVMRDIGELIDSEKLYYEKNLEDTDIMDN